MKTKTKLIRTPTACPYCNSIGRVPREWLGHPVVCCECGGAYRAIGTLPALPPAPPKDATPDKSTVYPDDPDYDCRGGLIGGLIALAGVWLLVWLVAVAAEWMVTG